MSWLRSPVTAALISLGFFLSAAGSFLGQAPPWPSTLIWGLFSTTAGLSVVWSHLHPSLDTEAFATSVVVTVALVRAFGYAVSIDILLALRMAGAGVWLIVFGLALKRRKVRLK